MNSQTMMEVLTTIVKEGRIEDGKIFIDKYAIMIAPNLKDPDKTLNSIVTSKRMIMVIH